MKRPLIFIIIGLVVATGIVLAVVGRGGDDNTSTTDTSTSQSTQNAQEAQDSNSTTSDTSTSTTTTITYDENGFSPAQVTVKSGGTISFINKTSRMIDLDSDPHPQHTSNRELNVGDIEAGASKTVTVTTKGNYGMHNHLDPSMKGSVTVQ